MIYRGKSDHYIQSITRIKRFEVIVIVIEKKKKASEMEVSWVVPIGTKIEAMKITVPRTRISVTLLY